MISEVESTQNGSIKRSELRRGHDVWEYRWREPGADCKRKHRRMVVGSVNQFRDKELVIRATTALRRDINIANVLGKGKPITLSPLADHYSQRELAPNNRWNTHSTKLGYRGYLRKGIVPRWGGNAMTRIWAGEIELWLRSLPLARSTCAKIRNVRSILFNHGLRHELLDRKPDAITTLRSLVTRDLTSASLVDDTSQCGFVVRKSPSLRALPT